MQLHKLKHGIASNQIDHLLPSVIEHDIIFVIGMLIHQYFGKAAVVFLTRRTSAVFAGILVIWQVICVRFILENIVKIVAKDKRCLANKWHIGDLIA